MGIISLDLLIIIIIESCVLLQKKIEEIFPLTLCILILIMQILGMFQMLSTIIIVLAAFAIIFGCKILYLKRSDNGVSIIKENIQNYVFTLGLLIIIETVLLCIFFEKGRIVGTYDEFNFWATAVKSLWQYDGFAEAKDMWAIWEYPQAMPLLQWFGVYIKGNFSDDILYIMRLVFDFSFIISLLNKIKVKWYFSPLISILIIIFPSIVNATSYMTLSVDGDLAILFGYTFCCIWDRTKTDFFYYFRIAILLCTIILTKSLSILWVGYLVFFLIIIEFFEIRNKEIKLNDKRMLQKSSYIGLCILAPLVTLKSWSLFLATTGSRSLHASARASSAISSILTGTWTWSGYEADFILSFIKAFFARPASYVAGGKNNFLTPFLITVIIIMIIRYVAQKQKMSAELQKILYIYLGLVSISYYFVFIITMCTVFVGEIQKYSKLNATALVCGRYCAPIFLGFLLFALHLFVDFISTDMGIEKSVKKKICVWGIILIIICSNMSALKGACWVIPSRRQEAEKALIKREKKTYEIFSWTKLLENFTGKKKIYWITTENLDMAYVYILYPVMIQKHNNNAYFASVGEFQNYIYDSGCQYIYYDSEIENNYIIELLNLMMEENLQIEVGGLYKIDMSHVGFQLQKIE